MYTPETTLMQQVPADQRVPWDNILRGEYIAKIYSNLWRSEAEGSKIQLE